MSGENIEIRDPLYGFVEVDPFEKEIMDHPVFQRLRKVKQLALTEYVYPGAVHARFEHSLGVMHLANEMYQSIVNKPKNQALLKEQFGLTDDGIKRYRHVVRLAGLLHDVGHAPFSHASEDLMPKDGGGKHYSHEQYSVAIIRGPLREVFEGSRFNTRNSNIQVDEVAALLEANAAKLKGQLFWRVLISGQLDADRADYLLRDSHHIGVKYGVYDYCRLLNTLALGTYPEDDEVVLGISEGGWHVAEAVIIARYQMFTQVYFHKTRRAYDYHLRMALKSVLPNGAYPSPNDLEAYLQWDDIRAWDAIRTNASNTDCHAVLNRQHLKRLYSTPEMPLDEDLKKVDAIKEMLDNAGIWCYMDRAESSWYKYSDQGSSEINIIRENGSATPLSNYSRIVKNMGDNKRISIYVKEADRKKAKELTGI